jgi:hypothetical protein
MLCTSVQNRDRRLWNGELILCSNHGVGTGDGMRMNGSRLSAGTFISRDCRPWKPKGSLTPLSEYERKVLQELERNLVGRDPALAGHLESGWPERRLAPRGRLNSAVLVAGLVMIVLGCMGTLVRKYYSGQE